MERQIKTKYDIGQEVWAVLYPTSWTRHEDFKLGLYKKKIQDIRVLFLGGESGYEVQYFLEGLTSFEGENWFSEVPDNAGGGDIYETREEAEEFLKTWEAL